MRNWGVSFKCPILTSLTLTCTMRWKRDEVGNPLGGERYEEFLKKRSSAGRRLVGWGRDEWSKKRVLGRISQNTKEGGGKGNQRNPETKSNAKKRTDLLMLDYLVTAGGRKGNPF